VSGRITGAERIPEPREINDAIAGIYGRNPFGGGLFRFVWGQSETISVRGNEGKYRDMLVGHNKPAWLLQRWCAPELFWTPELYYKMSCDDSGLSLTGEYPQFGQYHTIITFIENKIVDGELVIETIPLSFEIVESLIPVLDAVIHMTQAEMLAAAEQMEARENAEKVLAIVDRLEEAIPAFYGAVSYAGQTNRTGSAFTREVEKKKKQIERVWNKKRVAERRPKPMRGFYQEAI
jgi:hypothetical protein